MINSHDVQLVNYPAKIQCPAWGRRWPVCCDISLRGKGPGPGPLASVEHLSWHDVWCVYSALSSPYAKFKTAVDIA